MGGPFVIGGRYRNRVGPYEVVKLGSKKMVIRYEDGTLLSTTVAMQQRIWHNIQLEEDTEPKASRLSVVLPTFLTKATVYEPTESPSALLDQFEREELKRVETFWQPHQTHWDADSRRLTASDGSVLELSRALSDRNESQDSALHSIHFAVDDALQSENSALIMWAALYVGHAVFRVRVSPPPPEFYVEAMQRIAKHLLQRPTLLSECMNLAINKRRDRNEVSTYIADDLTSLYLRCCLLAGQGCFTSHVDLGKIILGYLDSLGLERLRAIAFHSAWVLASRIPIQALNLLAPDHTEGEKWVSQGYLHRKQNEANGLRQQWEIPWHRLNQLTKSCWQEIQQTRRYAVPSQGRAEVLIDDELLSTLGLTSLRFVQEGIKAPGVYIRFHFGEPPWQVAIVRVTSEGEVEGFYEQQRGLLNAAVHGVALTYYRDLVVPGEEVIYEPTGIRSSSGTPGPPRPQKPRVIPRRRQIRVGPGVVEFDEWHYTQERAQHSVVGHPRWVSPGFVASWEKQQRAREAGVWLQKGYTWVVEHERGGSGSGRLNLNKGDLTSRTLFYAPARASADLVKVLL